MKLNENAKTITDASGYLQIRAYQLLKHGYKFDRFEPFGEGVSAFFIKDGVTYQSIYILEQHRGKGHYKKNIKNTIITSYQCDIDGYLESHNFDYVIVDLYEYSGYNYVYQVLGEDIAKRSGVRLMNHIDEGLYILNQLDADDNTKLSYIFHPLFQSDESLIDNMRVFGLMDGVVGALVMEYRSVANEYLSTRYINNIDEIRLSPIDAVNKMLIADKIQNRKDFEIYHKGTHKRSDALSIYFNNWFDRLEISEEVYNKYKDFITIKF